MRLLVDQNISHRLLPLIAEGYNEVHHVKSLGLINYECLKRIRFDFKSLFSLNCITKSRGKWYQHQDNFAGMVN